MIRQQEEQQQQQQSGADQGWRIIVLITNPFHQLRSYHTFKHAMGELGMPVDDQRPGGYRLYVAAAPLAGHRGYGAPLDALADQWDFWRELAALGYYGLRGWLA
jgi:uncharacterized SAM-binding protein YcdF (DUF218 family)